MPGDYTVTETVPAGWTEVSKPGPITLVCASNTTADFVNQELLCINGTKTRSCDNEPVSGTTITLTNSSGTVATKIGRASCRERVYSRMPAGSTKNNTVTASRNEISKP